MFDDEKLNLTYPCRWEYKIIAVAPEHVRRAVAAVIGDLPHILSASAISRTGRYCSLRLEATVPDEATRLELFHALRNHPDVLMVL